MKFKCSTVVVLTFFLASSGFAQVGDWPAYPGYTYFGAPTLNQSLLGNYAALQDKTNGTSFFNSPVEVRFRINNADKMILSNSGNFGIGLTNPSTKFHLLNGSANTNFSSLGTSDIPILVQSSNSTNNNFNLIAFSDANNWAVAGIGGVMKDHTNHTGSLSFFTRKNGETPQVKMSLDENGNLGIGTSSPSFPLDVQGFVSRLKNPGTALNNYTSFRIQGPDYSQGLEIDYFGNNNLTTDLNWSYGGGAGSGAIVNINAKPLVFGTNNLGRVIIDASGNVGIGTFSPNQKLTVNGTIYGKEVKVDLNVPGPDYVFEDDYPLTSLDDIQSYIKDHKHLPEVPSAVQMEEEGINVGQMNMILLKKVEELTLYVINQDKEIKALKKEFDCRNSTIQSVKN